MKKQYIFVFLALGVCFVLFQNFGNWRRPNPRPTPVNPQPTNPTQPTLPPGASVQVKVYGYSYAQDFNAYFRGDSYIYAEKSAVDQALSYCNNNSKIGFLYYFISVIVPSANVTVVNITNSKGESIETLCELLKIASR